MSENFVGEIRMFAGNFAPVRWALCDGQELPISQNDALFSLLRTAYGGNGTTTFRLPDMRGRLPVSQGTTVFGSSYTLGQSFGTETVTLTEQEMPAHTHGMVASEDTADSANPLGRVFANTDEAKAYASGTDHTVHLSEQMLSPSGGGEPHENRMPALCVNFIIALQGIYPSRN